MKSAIFASFIITLVSARSSYYIPWKSDNNKCRPGYNLKNGRCWKSTNIPSRSSVLTSKHLLIASKETVSLFRVKSDATLVNLDSWSLPFQSEIPYIVKGPKSIEVFGDHTKKVKKHFRLESNQFEKENAFPAFS